MENLLDAKTPNNPTFMESAIAELAETNEVNFYIMRRVKIIANKLEVEVAKSSENESSQKEPETLPEKIIYMMQLINKGHKQIEADLATIEKYI